MAAILGKRAATDRSLSIFKFSFNLLRSFSTASSTSPNASSSSAASKKSKRRKNKNLFEVVQFLPKWGIGYHMAKKHWTNVSYQITKINLYKDGRHGKAWGIVYKDGLPAADAPRKISGGHKRCWRYLPSLPKVMESISNSAKSTENPSAGEVQTA